jgi:hypothetical protein
VADDIVGGNGRAIAIDDERASNGQATCAAATIFEFVDNDAGAIGDG